METLDQAIDAGGGLKNFAALVPCEPNQLSNWRTRGIPTDKCAAVQIASGNKFKRWKMRPDDWFIVWPELIGTKGAPRVPAKASAA